MFFMNKTTDEYEKWTAKVWVQGSGTKVVTIPYRVADFGGYEAGDELIILSKKKKEVLQDGTKEESAVEDTAGTS